MKWLAQLSRVVVILFIAARHGIAFLWTRRRGARRGPAAPERLRIALEDLGGSFVKFGQLLALQPDIIPREYCNALFDLLDSVPPFDFHNVERTFVEDLGRTPSELFDSIDRRPMASASIAQVHIAFLDGRKLAVKVQRPNIERLLAADLQLLRVAVGIIRLARLRHLYWLVRIIRELITWSEEELDFRTEAGFMAAMGFNSRDTKREDVPEVLERFTTRRILVAEFLEGPTVLDYIRSVEREDTSLADRLRASGFDADSLARNIVHNFVNDAFAHGLFHADLHPANLIILPDNVVGYVDFGITGSLSHYSRRHLIALTLALTRGDDDAMLACLFKIATIDEHSDLEEYRREFPRMTAEWYELGGRNRGLRKNFTRVMGDFLRLSRKTGVLPMEDSMRYLRSVITVDGLITRIAPTFNVARYLEKTCERSITREMWRGWLAVENLADWTATSARVLQRGPEAVSGLLRGRNGSLSRRTDEEDPYTAGRRRAIELRARQLATIAGVSALLAVASATHSDIGWNLFTAELTAAAVAAVMLLLTVRSHS